MELERNTTYGFRADVFGTELEEKEHVYLKEHTYRLNDYKYNDEDYEEEAKKFLVGKCEVKEMNVSTVSFNTMRYWADADSDEFVEALTKYRNKNRENMEWVTKVVFISRLKILKKYRNKGYGTAFLQSIIKDLEGYNTLFLLEACPTCDKLKGKKREEYIKKNTPKLEQFYNRLGYEKINKKCPYMAQYIE